MQLLMGVRGVWVSQAAERRGCRVSFVSVEAPSFSGGWLCPQCCVQPTKGCGKPGEGASDLALLTGARSYLCTGRAGRVRIPRHLYRCLNCHYSGFTPSSALSTCDCPVNITLGALKNLTHHSSSSYSCNLS